MEAHQITDEQRAHYAPHRRRAAAFDATLRRTLDLLLAGALLLLLAPLLLVIAIAIRLDSPGPSLYRQRRLGRGLRPFVVNKFRSMRTDAAATPHQDYVRALITGCGPELAQGGENLYKLAVDDRITRVGRLLRRFSLDELPQLWNVVRGDMSLVGPRPVIPYEVEHYPDWYRERFEVKPGLTGLWQVSGRNERTYEQMVRFDVEYARTQRLWLDLGILAKTVWVVIRGKGAA
jgi:lipopolysaccharide/colanic/teichoic acid biosynthesis glycosyltransferase